MSYFLDSVCTIVGIFHKYARCQHGNLALNRREMKMLIQKEFGEVLEVSTNCGDEGLNPCDPQIIELTFKLLDVNGDSLVDFNEYLIFVFQIAKGCYRYLQPREYLLRDENVVLKHEWIMQSTMLKEAGYLMNSENAKMDGGTWKRTMSGGLVPLNPVGLMSAKIGFITEAQ
ncbi:trichohyalin-like protein 1 [Crotalus tigris]|uniref:trichohyalin-like protein 1 n=1 Tax=Crotalus tigris TaxID=88082 RepID=UPI00192F4316|nr:trichohyalin-like protein 1 [Crotalus tigris]